MEQVVIKATPISQYFFSNSKLSLLSDYITYFHFCKEVSVLENVLEKFNRYSYVTIISLPFCMFLHGKFRSHGRWHGDWLADLSGEGEEPAWGRDAGHRAAEWGLSAAGWRVIQRSYGKQHGVCIPGSAGCSVLLCEWKHTPLIVPFIK